MKKTKIIIPIIYFILCLFISFNRIPFWDEARVWLIAQNTNIPEFINMMKLDCHLFIWYALIAPFAKNNFFYPYSMYILNTIFATSAIFILWKKSPFNTFEKTMITFSVPFVFLWGSVARCYSIGILLIFLALGIYQKRFEKKYLYTTLLAIALNTSVMSFIGAFYLIVIFIYELIKQKKDFIKPLLIFITSLTIVAIQLFDPNPDYLKQAPEMLFLRDMIAYLLNPIVYIEQYKLQSILMSITRSFVLITLFSYFIYAFKNNKKLFLFSLLSSISLIGIFTKYYSGNFWHYFYFYFYLIVSFWLLKQEAKVSKYLNIIFAIILTCFIFKGSLFIDSKPTIINDSKSTHIAKILLNDPLFQNKKLFCLDPWSDLVPATLPFLKNKLTIYDIYNQDRFSAKSLRSQIRFNIGRFNADEFYNYVEKDSLLLTTGVFIEHEINNPDLNYDLKTGTLYFKGNKHNITFIPAYSNKQINLYAFQIVLD